MDLVREGGGRILMQGSGLWDESREVRCNEDDFTSTPPKQPLPSRLERTPSSEAVLVCTPNLLSLNRPSMLPPPTY